MPRRWLHSTPSHGRPRPVASAWQRYVAPPASSSHSWQVPPIHPVASPCSPAPACVAESASGHAWLAALPRSAPGVSVPLPSPLSPFSAHRSLPFRWHHQPPGHALHPVHSGAQVPASFAVPVSCHASPVLLLLAGLVCVPAPSSVVPHVRLHVSGQPHSVQPHLHTQKVHGCCYDLAYSVADQRARPRHGLSLASLSHGSSGTQRRSLQEPQVACAEQRQLVCGHPKVVYQPRGHPRNLLERPTQACRQPVVGLAPLVQLLHPRAVEPLPPLQPPVPRCLPCSAYHLAPWKASSSQAAARMHHRLPAVGLDPS
mmetsp:Transcript_18290/g.42681  ORF Transcript_18290/g.42681 Transcript_18290/m.42681 type:complete len:314 (-) Transcript_18290:761-1702(-)